MGNADLKDKLAARAANPFDKTIAAVGVKYTLSKNTSIYARYVEEKNDNIASGAANLARASGFTNTTTSAATAAKVQTTLIGMQTNF